MHPRTYIMAPPAAAPAGRIPRLVGWILLAPATVLFLFSYMIPSIDLLLEASRSGGSGREFATSSAYLSTLGYALSFALLPLLILVTVAPAFAWAASRAGLAGRWAARAALALPLAAFAPAGLAVIWASRNVPEDVRGSDSMMDTRLVMVAMMGGFFVAVAVTCYLSALRRHEPGARTWPVLVTVGAVLALVTVAAAVQLYTFVAVLNSHPAFGSLEVTPMGLLAPAGAGLPTGAATAVTVLPILMVLGVATALVMLRSGLRLEFNPAIRSTDDRGTPAGVRTAALLVTAAGVVVLVLFIGFQLGPWLSVVAMGQAELPAEFAAGSVLTNTWLIPLGTSIIQVGAAALAAFGIAVVRPIGRGSEWLLLVFAPWLLVGNGLLEASRLSTEPEGLQPLIAYAPPSWLSLPALFLFVLLFRGQAAAWWRLQAAHHPYAFLRTMWPALPMLVLATGVAWLIQAQDLLVPTMADQDQGVVPNAQLFVVGGSVLRPFRDEDLAGLGYPLALLVLFTLGALVFQWAYLDRISIRTGRPELGEGATRYQSPQYGVR